MSILNTIVCSAAGGNTGVADCSLSLKNILGGFLVPNSFELTEAQMADSVSLLAALSAAVNNDSPALRIYPLPENVGMTDNSEDVVTNTLGYGAAVPVRDGNYNLTFQYTRGGNCLNNSLRKFNGGNYRFLGYDASGILFGTKVGTSLKGIPLDYFYAAPFKLNDGSNIAAFTYRLSFRPNYINEGLGFVALNVSDLLNINGLQNIVLRLAAARAVNVIKVKATTGCAGLDLADDYSDELAIVGNWVARRNGALVTITSVAFDANLKAFTLTLDAADPDYNAAGPFVVTLAPVSVLTAAGVVGYEGLSLLVP